MTQICLGSTAACSAGLRLDWLPVKGCISFLMSPHVLYKLGPKLPTLKLEAHRSMCWLNSEPCVLPAQFKPSVWFGLMVARDQFAQCCRDPGRLELWTSVFCAAPCCAVDKLRKGLFSSWHQQQSINIRFFFSSVAIKIAIMLAISGLRCRFCFYHVHAYIDILTNIADISVLCLLPAIKQQPGKMFLFVTWPHTDASRTASLHRAPSICGTSVLQSSQTLLWSQLLVLF